MSVFTDHTAAFEAAFADLAETVTYNGAELPAVLTYGPVAGEVSGMPSRSDMAELDVLKSDVAAPAYRDTVVIGATTWTVHRVLSGDEWAWHLLISTNERLTR